MLKVKLIIPLYNYRSQDQGIVRLSPANHNDTEIEMTSEVEFTEDESNEAGGIANCPWWIAPICFSGASCVIEIPSKDYFAS